MSYDKNNLKIDSRITEILQQYKLPTENLGFGKTVAPIMIECDYDKGTWGEMRLVPYGPIKLDPTAKVLHYAQEIFEGLKAYNVDHRGPLLFRALENAKRFNLSADRMAMPEVPVEMFMAAVEAITGHLAPFIPQNSGESLYLRPFMFASESELGIKPAEQFKFMVVASPSGSYFTEGSLSVLIERAAVRAFPGGTGMAKTGGNYARSLKTAIEARKIGYQQTLWLDATDHRMIEEMSGMNFFAVVNGELITPPTSDTILNGITRSSIIELAKNKKLVVKEQKIDIEHLISMIKSGNCTEAFACGTAVIITPVKLLGEKNGTTYELPQSPGPITQELKFELLAIQEGRKPDPFNWSHKVSSPKLENN